MNVQYELVKACFSSPRNSRGSPALPGALFLFLPRSVELHELLEKDALRPPMAAKGKIPLPTRHRMPSDRKEGGDVKSRCLKTISREGTRLQAMSTNIGADHSAIL